MKPELEKLSSATQAAAATQAKIDSAFDDEAQAEAELLQAAIEVAKPGLAAISSRIKTTSKQELHGYALVIGHQMLILCSDGQLMDCGSKNTPITPRQAVVDWDLTTVIGALASAMERVAKGNGLKRADEAQRRAAKLRAIATLVA